MDGQENQALELIAVDQKVFSAKYSTKGEVYRFLTVEACIYLCPYENVTIWHIKDLAAGEKTVSGIEIYLTL